MNTSSSVGLKFNDTVYIKGASLHNFIECYFSKSAEVRGREFTLINIKKDKVYLKERTPKEESASLKSKFVNCVIALSWFTGIIPVIFFTLRKLEHSALRGKTILFVKKIKDSTQSHASKDVLLKVTSPVIDLSSSWRVIEKS